MANEITVSLALSCFKAAIMGAAIGKALNGLLFTMSGTLYNEGSILVGTSATAIPLGQVTAPHWAYFLNKDGTNYLTIRNGAAGADLVKLLPGEPALLPLLDTAVPYAVAHTAACQLEYLILSL